MQFTTAIIKLPVIEETSGVALRTPLDVLKQCSDIQNLAQETFHVLVLNSRNRLLERSMATMGIADAALIHPREVFRTAILKNGSAIIIAHNHPSGETAPSPEDIKITKQLIEAGRIIEIKVLDHVIIGKETDSQKAVFSLREEGICKF